MAQPALPPPPSAKDGIYEALLIWGGLVIAVLIVSFLLLCTPLGHPCKRRILRLRRGGTHSLKQDQLNPQGFYDQTHAFQFRSPQIGTPAPPYQVVFSISPPPMVYMPSSNRETHNTSPVLSHRFSEIPRAEACYGLGIQVHREESQPTEKGSNRAISETFSVDVHPSAASPSFDSDVPTLVSEPARVPTFRHIPRSESANVRSFDAHSATESLRRDRYRAMVQSH